jgi:hypothetical protein
MIKSNGVKWLESILEYRELQAKRERIELLFYIGGAIGFGLLTYFVAIGY